MIKKYLIILRKKEVPNGSNAVWACGLLAWEKINTQGVALYKNMKLNKILTVRAQTPPIDVFGPFFVVNRFLVKYIIIDI
jgi:hypothetical protein